MDRLCGHDVILQRFRQNGSGLWLFYRDSHVNDNFINVLLYEVREKVVDNFDRSYLDDFFNC